MSVLQLLPQHMNWLSQRFAVASGNVANLDTPGYRAKQVTEFEPVIQGMAIGLKQTNDAHLDMSGGHAEGFEIKPSASTDESHSKNNVVLEEEMRTIGESSRLINMESALYRVFHRMTIASVK